MNEKLALEKCQTYIDAQLEFGSRTGSTRAGRRREPAIAISRQTGAGALRTAEELAAYLQEHGPKGKPPWTVFDRNLVEQVLQEHNLPQQLAQYMPEDRVSQISDMVEELLGLHPPSWTLLRQTTETILHLAELGNVILIGRGANVITAKLDNVFHARLIGSEEVRVGRVEEHYRLEHKPALEFLRKADRGRKRYLRRYFHQNIDNPLLYHLTLNTDRLTVSQAAELLGDAVIRKFYRA
jgi:hypothetical protein